MGSPQWGIPQAGKNHEEIGFFIRETGSEQRSTEFSGLRMRDGEARQGATPPEPPDFSLSLGDCFQVAVA